MKPTDLMQRLMDAFQRFHAKEPERAVEWLEEMEMHYFGRTFGTRSKEDVQP